MNAEAIVMGRFRKARRGYRTDSGYIGNFPGYCHYLAMDVHEIRLVQSITKEARVVVESVDYSNFYLASKLPT